MANCKQKDEMVDRIISECSKIVRLTINNVTMNCYNQKIKEVVENGDVNIAYDFCIPTNS
ncbi:hypothetical protein E2320_018904 [Naja naja]|nr:hypothetical protein E2320_018904 [Naja naja]